MTDGPICVVHLVRAANGLAVFDRFLRALTASPPGIDFELVLAMKGFSDTDADAAREHLDAAADASHEAIYFEDERLDLDVYAAAAEELGRERYCFLNSFSEPLAAGWLARLDEALGTPGVALAGATGSWASSRSWMAHALGLPSAYRGVLPPRRQAIDQFMAVEAERRADTPDPAPEAAGGTMRRRFAAVRELVGQQVPFERFPAPHVRTNAFAIARETLVRLEVPRVRTKGDAYRLESGRHNLARRVERLGRRAVVVDRSGELYDHPDWPRSRTFWQGRQEGLLVADNQTRGYASGDAGTRRLLSGFAWGREADPDLPEHAASRVSA